MYMNFHKGGPNNTKFFWGLLDFWGQAKDRTLKFRLQNKKDYRKQFLPVSGL